MPIYYDEFGVEAQIPPAKTSLYTGREPVTVKPVPEAVQGAYYRQVVELAFCQPNLPAPVKPKIEREDEDELRQ